MIASLLPGFRDLRTPLVTGYLWLAVVWLWFGSDRLIPEDSNPFVDRLLEATHVFGSASAVAVLSFGAYLIGSILTKSTAWPLNGVVRSIRSTVSEYSLVHRWSVWRLHLRFPRRTSIGASSSDPRLDAWLEEQVGLLLNRYGSPKDVIGHRWATRSLRQWYRDICEHQFELPEDEQPIHSLRGALSQIVQQELQESLVVRMQIERQSRGMPTTGSSARLNCGSASSRPSQSW